MDQLRPQKDASNININININMALLNWLYRDSIHSFFHWKIKYKFAA